MFLDEILHILNTFLCYTYMYSRKVVHDRSKWNVQLAYYFNNIMYIDVDACIMFTHSLERGICNNIIQYQNNQH